MPKLYTIGRYVIFFWSNENNEPVHVHVAPRRVSEHSVKIWLTKDGGCLVKKNNKDIIHPLYLDKLLDFIRTNHTEICEQWKKHFSTQELRFFC